MTGQQPEFVPLRYITITRDPRTQMVVAVGGDEQAAGILQSVGRFLPHGKNQPYLYQPRALSFDLQRHGATAAAYELLRSGFSVFLDPDLNELITPDADRYAAQRYLQELGCRVREAAGDRDVAEILTALVAPAEGLLSQVDETLTAVWFAWARRREADGRDIDLPDDLMAATDRFRQALAHLAAVRDVAAQRPPSHRTEGPSGSRRPPVRQAGRPTR